MAEILHCGVTERHIDIAQLVAEGLTNKQIAKHLNLSPETVKCHLQTIMKRTGLRREQLWLLLANVEGSLHNLGGLIGGMGIGDRSSVVVRLTRQIALTREKTGKVRIVHGGLNDLRT
jgi:DNA-binding NarL/FixJ family response regulator